MPELRLKIAKTKEEWDKLEKIIQEKNGGRKVAQRGSGLSQFIAKEISRTFKGKKKDDCSDKKTVRVKKNFNIVVTADELDAIICEARCSGVRPGDLIAKLVIDPHLSFIRGQHSSAQV